MARARNIKPGFFTNEDMVELPFGVRLLFIGLWTLADREGRLEDRPKRIKMALFPADDLDVNDGLNALQDSKFIERYEANGIQYIQIVNFKKHQNPHRDERESTIPAPCEHSASAVQANKPALLAQPVTDSLNPVTDSPIPDSLNPETPNKTTTAADGGSNDDQFAEFWKIYPKKIGKGGALRAWKKLKRPAETIGQIHKALAWQIESDQWRKDSGQFIPNPETYLNQQRWLDEPPSQAPPQKMTAVGQRATQAANRWLQTQGVSIEGVE